MATNFLQATGASTAGYFSAVTTVISSELVSLASSAVALGGTVFTSSGNLGQAIWGEVLVKMGGALTPAAGGFLAGWFARTPDGGTTFETIIASTNASGRAPDFTIAFASTTYANTNILYGSGIVKLPWSPFKVLVQNSAGAALPSSATAYTAIQIGPVAVQY